MSASSTHPDGLGNSSGLVGKNLMLHPNSSVTGYYDDDLQSYLGPAGQLIHSMEFYDTRPEPDFVRGIKMMILPTPGPLNALEAYRSKGFDDVWGPPVHDIVGRHGSGILWCANTEDLPEESNTVTLDDTRRPGPPGAQGQLPHLGEHPRPDGHRPRPVRRRLLGQDARRR